MWLAFDTGHLMSEPLEGIPRLDHAVNAGLLLSYACLETGDRVGLFAFDEKPRLFQREQAGIRALKQLQRRCAELEYGVGETNFGLGLTELSSRIRRRALVIVFTELVDTTSAEIMVRRLGETGSSPSRVVRDPERRRSRALRGGGARTRSRVSIGRWWRVRCCGNAVKSRAASNAPVSSAWTPNQRRCRLIWSVATLISSGGS